MLLILSVKMHGLFLWKIRKAFQLLILFQKFHMNLMANQTKYGKVNAANFIIDQWNHGYKIIMWKCIHYITKENLLSLKGLLEL